MNIILAILKKQFCLEDATNLDILSHRKKTRKIILTTGIVTALINLARRLSIIKIICSFFRNFNINISLAV